MLYLDVYFLLNFMMDLAAICIAATIDYERIRFRRKVTASLIGAFSGCAILISARYLPDLLCWNRYEVAVCCIHLVVNPLMIFVAFGFGDMKTFIRHLFLSYAAVFILGGCMNFIYRTVFGGNHSILVCAMVSAGLAFVLTKVLTFVRERTAHIYPVTLELNGVSAQYFALIDSGNRLRDPYRHQPVSMLCKTSVLPEWDNKKVRYMPIDTAGGEHSLITIQTFDYLKIQMGNRMVQVKNPVIGISERMSFCEGKCQMLLHPGLSGAGRVN